MLVSIGKEKEVFRNFAPQCSAKQRNLVRTPTLITVSCLHKSSTLALLVTSISPFHLSMESRKRPHSLEDEPTIQKKLKISSMNGTPHLNGVVNDADEPKDSDNLEVKIL